MTSYFSYRVKLIGNQKSKLADAIQNKSAVTLRLSNDELSEGLNGGVKMSVVG